MSDAAYALLLSAAAAGLSLFTAYARRQSPAARTVRRLRAAPSLPHSRLPP